VDVTPISYDMGYSLSPRPRLRKRGGRYCATDAQILRRDFTDKKRCFCITARAEGYEQIIRKRILVYEGVGLWMLHPYLTIWATPFRLVRG